jgi:hypothetical protein
VGQIGSVYKQPETEEDDSVTAGGRQVSERGAMGSKGGKGQKVIAP